MNTVQPIVVNAYYTLIAAAIVLLIGRVIVKKVNFFQNFNIPEPVVGGLLAASLLTTIYFAFNGMSFTFEKSLQDSFMLMFFTSIGLSADFKRLKEGGLPLVIFLVIVSVFILIQNMVGMGMAYALGQNPLMGLITGSITLTGGHGTGAAWGKTLFEDYGVQGAVEMAMISATFGLVAGGIIGGPVARRLINKMGKQPISQSEIQANQQNDGKGNDTFENFKKERLITAESAIETMALFAACLAFSALASGWVNGLIESGVIPKYLKLPQFVYALGFGVILRNILTHVFKFDMFDRAIDVFGNASLSLFLAIALMSIKLWDLAGLAGPMMIILTVQVVVMILYSYLITARFMGNNYDGAVFAAGHCGFGLGATPTAVANMQSVTQTFGYSHKAFLIVPMVGAFFIDLVNASILGAIVGFFS